MLMDLLVPPGPPEEGWAETDSCVGVFISKRKPAKLTA